MSCLDERVFGVLGLKVLGKHLDALRGLLADRALRACTSGEGGEHSVCVHQGGIWSALRGLLAVQAQ